MTDLGPRDHRPFVIPNGASICLVGADDASWSVFDCLRIAGRLVIVGTGSPNARFRLFAPVAGQPRVYEFHGDESREPEAQNLARQLRAAVALDERG